MRVSTLKFLSPTLTSLSFFFSLFVTTPAVSRAEDLNEIFKRVNELVAEKNYSKAIEELGWAKKEIEKLNTTQIQSFFPETLGDFKGGKIEQGGALGITNIERTYKKDGSNGSSPEIKVSLTGGSGGSGTEGLGSLMAFGKMAAMMDGAQNSFRISGKTATLTEVGSGAELTIFLDSGSVLKFEGLYGIDGPTLRSLAEGFKLNDLDKYLKG